MTSSKQFYLAPGHGGASAYQAPGAAAERVYLPGAMSSRPSSPVQRIDNRGVTPETGFELLDGQLIAQPASPPHSICQMRLDYVIKAYVAPGYLGAADMLTRTSERWDFAADASVYKDGIDPQTGSRYLEELAFEVKYTQKPGMLAKRARQLNQRGVRRIFAIWVEEHKQGGKLVVEAGPVKEWDSQADTWRELDPDSEIRDECLYRPLKVRALLSALEADNAVASVLLDRGNPVLRAREAEVSQQALAKAVLRLCKLHGVAVNAGRMEALQAMNAEQLIELLEAISADQRWPENQ